MMSGSLIRNVLIVLCIVVFARVLVGPWGWVGAGDAALYQDIKLCVDAPQESLVRACFRPAHTSAMLPVAVVGLSSKLAGADSLATMLRLWSGLMSVLALLLIFQLARTKNRFQDGFAAFALLLLGTPLLERASSGGPEVWILASLLGLAWLLGEIQRKTLYALLAIVLSCVLLTSHPYSAPVLILLLFVSLFQSRPLGPRVVGGRIWFGWIEARFLCASIGGLALFIIFWPGTGDGSLLWHHVTDIYKVSHPPLLVGGEAWLQGVEYASPPWWTTPWWLFLSIPLLIFPLFVAGISDIVRRVGPNLGSSEVSLILMAFGWWLICALQGSPVADGQDHRLILLGLLTPFAGRAFHWVERVARWLVHKGNERGRSWSRLGPGQAATLLFVFMLGPSVDTIWSGTPPTSVLVGERSGYIRYGMSPFARPELHTDWVEKHQGATIGCKPWGTLCQKELLPGLAAMGFLGPKDIARSDKEIGVLIVPRDSTFPLELEAASKRGSPSENHTDTDWVAFRALQP
jgi:hypothetical protein